MGWELVSMWRSPRMVGFTALTAVLYAALIYPFQQFTFFQGNADFLRVGMGIPVAFSFLFGPATAWGTAVGNVIYDASTGGLGAISVFGFIGNFLVGYIPYKLWSMVTTENPDLRSFKRVGLFVGLSVLACVLCGLVIGFGLYWLNIAPFMPTAMVIALTDALWAVVLGSVVLAFSYGPVSARRMLYTDVLYKKTAKPADATLKLKRP